MTNEFIWRPMPEIFTWHRDITPIAPYAIELKAGGFLKGAFYTHNGSHFATGINKGRIVFLHEIGSIIRLKSKESLFECPHCGVISANPTKDGKFPLRGCDNDHCETQWWVNICAQKGV
jgi:hypothetical protein